MTIEQLSREEITKYLCDQAIPLHEVAIIIADCLNSTNDHLLSLVSGSSITMPKTVLLAETQVGGRGRQGRTWVSPPGNIYMSLYWPFKCNLERLYGLSLVVGIAIARVLKDNGLHDVQLKWPNDIFWHEQKMGGILIETKQNHPGIIDTVIGVGLNLIDMNSFGESIGQKSVGLNSILNHKIPKNKLIAQIIIELHAVLSQFAYEGFGAFMDEWRALDCKIVSTTPINLEKLLNIDQRTVH